MALSGFQVVTWEHWHASCKLLAAKLPDDAYLIPVPRGGFLAMGTLFYIKPSLKPYPTWIDHPNLPHIVVDDICCTGKVREQWSSWPFAAVFWRSARSLKSPDFYGEEVKHRRYLVFPWESVEAVAEEIKKLEEKRNSFK